MFRRPSLVAVLASAAFLTAPAAASAFTMPAAPKAVERSQAGNAPVVLAQSGDVLSRIQRLEDEVRRLNGRVEELSFQLLQSQEDMRRAQENNEFRFQDLEQGAGSAGSGDGLPDQRGDLGTDTGTSTGADGGAGSDTAAAPTDGFSDEDIAGIIGDSGGSGDRGNTPPATSNQPVAAASGDAGTVYNEAYDQLLAGDYANAEQSFRQYVQTYPDAPDAADAQYWLGESLYQQQLYADAAEVFLNGQKDNPEADKAPDMMLKLGMSLAALGNDETACITYREVGDRYPQMSDSVRRKLGEEQKNAQC
ncbi:tol-pal system protein YbgF [Fulvimarina sp. MAC8]|uniref:tol-pal system protein YbgF n=1 Tax=Fulvimarina sp. MAC8 TaxID=3162874 RepID=UPI0032EE300D